MVELELILLLVRKYIKVKNLDLLASIGYQTYIIIL